MNPECPTCSKKLRFPLDKNIVARCPECGTEMEWAPGAGFLWFGKPDKPSEPSASSAPSKKKSAAPKKKKATRKAPARNKGAARKQSASRKTRSASPAPASTPRPTKRIRRKRQPNWILCLVILGLAYFGIQFLFFPGEDGAGFSLADIGGPHPLPEVNVQEAQSTAGQLESRGDLEGAVDLLADGAMLAVLGGDLDAADQLVSTIQDFGGVSGNTVIGEAEFTIPGLNIKMIQVPRGTYTAGSPDDENGRSSDETRKEHRISQPLWMGQTEVTYRQWQSLMGQTYKELFLAAQENPEEYEWREKADGSEHTAKMIPVADPERPVAYVTWHDAVAFCRKLTERERAAGRIPESYVYQLPGEYEWEVACRAESMGPFAGKPEAMTRYGKYQSQEVAQLAPNRWGFYDMHGNVWEWCRDGYKSGNRAIRGGSFYSELEECRSANRSAQDSEVRNAVIGFRLALKRKG